MSSRVPIELLRELGQSEGGADALRLLVDDQRVRRLLALRALLDAVDTARAPSVPRPAAARVAEHWALLEAADRANREETRHVLYYPLLGPWVRRALRGLAAAVPPPDLLPDLEHLGAVAAAAAARARLPFTLRLRAPGGTLALPTLGACTLPAAGPAGRGPLPDVQLTHDKGTLTLRPAAGPPVVLLRGPDGTWESADPAWRPLRPLTGGPRPVLLDDADPFRTADGGLERHGIRPAEPLTAAERAGWQAAWTGMWPLLERGGPARPLEAGVLLDCIVPLAPPPQAGPHATGPSHCSGTRREAFGAVLSSAPQTPAFLAATLVHELQHAKLAALAELTPLHHDTGTTRHWAPWRPDPRPFDGLLQGTYSHLALADYWQRFALSAENALERHTAWAEHSRCREQVGAALPTLLGSRALTPAGRVLAGAMADRLTRLRERPPPDGYLARASAYVETSRRMWRRQHAR
ncbi:HEXXH motif domain-containing protein [Streptomyces sp. Ru73]|uniref:HEXXH motif domain-containing protein n=1 Tax=Streptomyces sp. Ru73 TaxID=2080748 RepID=UPI000CDCEED1|nr:HEXXH motif domain-containing protein [Streptomyces sp. Ru73]POX41158.1 HEXXH motif domain-containing protein [Streptomyces sp. Ru73]